MRLLLIIPILLAATHSHAQIQLIGGNSATAERPPNIVFIMADDAGYECFDAYGDSAEYQTPHLKALADEGIRFNHCYSAPTCVPSRVQIMSGRYLHRPYQVNGQNHIYNGAYPTGLPSFCNKMEQRNYATCMVSKWQLKNFGEPLGNLKPEDFELNAWFLSPTPNANNGTRPTGAGGFYEFPSINNTDTWVQSTPTDYAPDMEAEYINQFITAEQARPFFIYWALHLPHAPYHYPPDVADTSDSTNFVMHREMVRYMDLKIHQVLQHIDSIPGLRENTLIIFTSDNGTPSGFPTTFNGQTIIGNKASMTDGGTRVPLICSWRGKTPPGSVSNDLIDFTDFFATFAAAAEIPIAPNEGIDGRSFLPQILGQPGTPREWAFLYYLNNTGSFRGYWARDQRWKLYDNNRLYDIQADVLENNPIQAADDTPESAAARSKLQAAFSQIGGL